MPGRSIHGLSQKASGRSDAPRAEEKAFRSVRSKRLGLVEIRHEILFGIDPLHLGPLTIPVGHANCPDDAAELEKLLRRDLPQIERLTMAQLGSALGVHAGPGSLVVAVQPFTTPPR